MLKTSFYVYVIQCGIVWWNRIVLIGMFGTKCQYVVSDRLIWPLNERKYIFNDTSISSRVTG